MTCIFSTKLQNDLYFEKYGLYFMTFKKICVLLPLGLSTSLKPAFRSYFARVGDLRANFPDAPMLCLTATASRKTQTKVKDLLALKDPLVVEQQPDRPNIRLYIDRVLPGPSCLDWLVELLRNASTCPKTIVYCRTFRVFHGLCSLHVQFGWAGCSAGKPGI